LWFDEKLAGPEIVVTPPAHAVAEVILQAPLLAPLRLIVPTHRLSTAALLPERIRQQYGLRWTPAHAVALPLAAHTFGYAVAPLFQVASRITTQKPGAPREPSRPRVPRITLWYESGIYAVVGRAPALATTGRRPVGGYRAPWAT
jgi:hypothetical protein